MKKQFIVLAVCLAAFTSCQKGFYVPEPGFQGPDVTIKNGKVHVSGSMFIPRSEVKQFFDSLFAGAQYQSDIFDFALPQDSAGYHFVVGLTFDANKK